MSANEPERRPKPEGIAGIGWTAILVGVAVFVAVVILVGLVVR